ncbi:MAG: YitT family protein [Christensenellales bacterium]|jgi:uncharacterized membrane-anchored protein YitT (DUF2179 family)
MGKKRFIDAFRDYLIISAGALLVAVGVYFFKLPNNFSTGGVTGIAVLLKPLLPGISTGTIITAINLLLLVAAFAVLGPRFGVRTVYGSLLMSGVLLVLEWLVPLTRPLTDQPLLELIFSVILPAVGSAILFNYRSSTGGTDIVAMIFRKYTHLDMGKALFCSDFLIASLSGVVFGVQTGLFSLLGLLSRALVVDNVVESINLSKYFTIVTTHAQEIVSFIRDDLHSTATLLQGEGAFSRDERRVILTVLSRSRAARLRGWIRKVDPQAFVVITNTSEIIGKGFRGELL